MCVACVRVVHLRAHMCTWSTFPESEMARLELREPLSPPLSTKAMTSSMCMCACAHVCLGVCVCDEMSVSICLCKCSGPLQDGAP